MHCQLRDLQNEIFYVTQEQAKLSTSLASMTPTDLQGRDCGSAQIDTW